MSPKNTTTQADPAASTTSEQPETQGLSAQQAGQPTPAAAPPATVSQPQPEQITEGDPLYSPNVSDQQGNLGGYEPGRVRDRWGSSGTISTKVKGSDNTPKHYGGAVAQQQEAEKQAREAELTDWRTISFADVQRMVDEGTITRDEAENSERANQNRPEVITWLTGA